MNGDSMWPEFETKQNKDLYKRLFHAGSYGMSRGQIAVIAAGRQIGKSRLHETLYGTLTKDRPQPTLEETVKANYFAQCENIGNKFWFDDMYESKQKEKKVKLIETKVFIMGTLAASYTNDQLFKMIKEVEADIESKKAIVHKPKSLIKAIDDLEKGLLKIVKYLDSRS